MFLIIRALIAALGGAVFDPEVNIDRATGNFQVFNDASDHTTIIYPFRFFQC